MDYDTYFSGEEEMDRGDDDEQGAVDETTGSAVVTFLPLVGTVTYDEAHSAILGFVAGFLIVVTGLLGAVNTALVMGLIAAARAAKGVGGRWVTVLTKEAHWFGGAGVLGILIGALARILLLSVGAL